VTQPGIPNDYSLSTSCYGTRLASIEAQAFAAVAMGFRRLELGLCDLPVPLNGFEESRRETGIEVASIVTGCLNPRSEHMSGTKLGSLDAELRERAMISCRRHIQLAGRYGCPTVILRGCEIEDPKIKVEAGALKTRLDEEGPDEVLQAEIVDFVARAQKRSQSQVEHLCRSIHALRHEFPDVRLAVEPGATFVDILNFEAMGWVLDDLTRQDLGYWHDTGTVHRRQLAGLPGQGEWLERCGERLIGIHLQDAVTNESEMPPGLGEVDFRMVADFVSNAAEKVVEINPRHGRSEILASVQFLIDRGF
jgi:sugar phosphate isomerase/epimerase